MITTRARYKKYAEITGTAQDDLIDLLIPNIEADYLTIRNAPFDEDSNGDIYPDGSELVAWQMISFMMRPENRGASGMHSETLLSYSYTKEKNSTGYPDSIVKRIKRYMGSKP